MIIFLRTIDWCACSPFNLRTEDLHIVSRKAVKAPGVFFARKFDPLTDQEIINHLEGEITDTEERPESWDYYWENSYNTLDDDDTTAVVEHLASIIVTNYLPGTHLVREVTTLLVGGNHYGEIIQFATAEEVFDAGEEVFEILVRPRQEVKIVEGHEDLVERTILNIQVGDHLDIKEKIFRNWIRAFDIHSKLVLRLEFGSSLSNNLFEILEISLHNNEDAEEGCLTLLVDWRVSVVFVPLSEISRKMSPGVWSVQISAEKRTFARLTFLILGQDTRSGISTISYN